jgi:ubiquinone/menaquinone biosynthesis C-methylase UbiE
MDARAWDERYAASDLVWGVEPNRWVAAELAGLPPGRALDVACGEGRNALWLARRGWTVTGADFSAVALERAARLAADAGVEERATWVRTNVVERLPPGPFDAVVVAYLQLPAEQRRATLAACAAALDHGGVLLVVAHDSTNLVDGVGGPQDPAVLYGATEVVADVAAVDGLVVEKATRVRRPVESDRGEREAIDALARLRRR